MKERLPYIDTIKGIAILLVVLGHILPMHTNVISVWIYSFHLPLFYIVNGILHNKKDNVDLSIGEYFVKKIKRMLFPYFVFSIITIIPLAINGVIVNDFSSTKSALLETFTLLGYSTLWFLPSLLFSELLFYCTIVLFRKKKKVLFAVLVLVLFGTFLFRRRICWQVLLEGKPVISFFCRIVLGYVFMIIGFSFAVFRDRHHLAENRFLSFVVGCSFLVMNIFFSGINPEVDIHFFYLGNPICFFVNAIMGSYGIILICEALVRKDSIISFFGRNSLIIMITHRPLSILYVLKKIMSKVNISYDWMSYILIFLGCILIESVLILLINRHLKFLIDFQEFKKVFTSKNKSLKHTENE